MGENSEESIAMKHLLSIGDLGKDDIIGLMDEADRFREALEGRELKKRPHHFHPLLRKLHPHPLLV